MSFVHFCFLPTPSAPLLFTLAQVQIGRHDSGRGWPTVSAFAMSHLSHAVPASLPCVRDSVDARSITPGKPTRWFLVPDFYAMFGVKTSAVRWGKDRRNLSQRSSGVTTAHGHWVFAGSECTGEKGDLIRLSPKLYCVSWTIYVYWISSCVHFHRLLRIPTFIPRFQCKDSSAGWRILRSR